MEQRIREIVNSISGLPEKDRDNILEFLFHNEWGVVLETLCAVIIEENILITQDVYNAIKNAGEDMKMESATWEYLIFLIITGNK